MKDVLIVKLKQELTLLVVALAVFGLSVAGVLASWKLPTTYWKHEIKWESLNAKPHWVVGRLAEVKDQPNNPKRVTLRLENIIIYQSDNAQIKALSIGMDRRQAEGRGLAVGEGVAAQVILFPPEGPKYLGDRDFRPFNRYRAGVAYGYVSGRAERTFMPPNRTESGGRVDALRAEISAKSAGLAAGVPAALLVGDTKAVTPEVTQAYRAAGLSHLLAISGMQLSVAGLGIYWLMRRLLTSWPRLALTHNIRLYAAIVGLAAVPLYALVAGAGVSVVRAALMVGFFLVAVVAGRLGGALRAWSLALIGMSLAWPESTLMAGFQLSFAATLALILGQQVGILAGHGLWGKAKQVVITSWLAGLATLPLVAWIFGQVSLVSLPANLLAVPLLGVVGTWLSLVVLALWPVGLGVYLLPALGWVCSLANGLALWAAQLPQALVIVPPAFALPLAGLCLVALLLCYVRAWLWAALFTLATLALAWAAAVTMPQSKVVILAGGEVTLTHTADKTYSLLWQPPYAAPAYRWAKRWGYEVAEKPLVEPVCDSTGCAYATPYGPVAVLKGTPTPEDCRLSRLIVAGGQGNCPQKTGVSGQFGWMLWP